MRIAIADDEERIRRGLAKLVREVSPDYEVVGLFPNGAELLRFVEEQGVDVVITDIRMPVTDGLKVAEKLHASYPDVRCIIVSGYNDFEYARTAFRHRVKDYLLKPLDKSELHRLLKQVEEELAAAKSRASAERKHVLQRVLAGEPASALLADDEYAVWYAVRTEQPIAVDPVIAYWGHYGERADTTVIRDRFYGILMRLRTAHMTEEAEEAGTSLALLLAESTAAVVGASMPFRGGRVREAFAEAERAAVTAMYRSERTAFVMAAAAAELESGTGARFGERLKTWEDAFMRSLQIVDRERVEQALIELFEELRRQQEPIEHVLDMLDRILHMAAREIREFAEEADRTFGSAAERRITMESFFKFDPLARWFVQRMADAVGRIRERRSGSARAIDEVKAYIAAAYREELDLSRLAERVYLTPSYLSKLFKQETGMTITDYAIQLRVDEAKRLLCGRPELKTYEVGAAVGYADSAYFTKLFKRVVGVTPNEYRQLVR